jgi:ribosomal protein S18 acetylase RimI-like enzyme
MTGNVTLRPLVTGDEPLLAHATLGNLNWSHGRFTEQDLASRADFGHYTQLVIARGDFGFVAERADSVCGVGWALFLPASDAGYGFLDGATPEISLWVRGDFRGRGVGTLLLRKLQQEAIDRDITRLSLSVEADNPAKRLYASEGFRQVEEGGREGVMAWVA